MFCRMLSACACGLLLAGQAMAQQFEMYDEVMPRENFEMKVGNRVVGDIDDTGLPLEIQKIQGEWLWVGSRTKGWVQKSRVVHIEQAPNYYTQLISRGAGASVYNLRAISYKALEKFDLALDDYNEALRLDPDPSNHDFYYGNRGNCYYKMGKLPEALADFNRALQINPNLVSVLETKAWMLACDVEESIHDGPAAVAAARKACELTGWKDMQMLRTLAAAYARTGNFDEAIRWIDVAVKYAPDDYWKDLLDIMRVEFEDKHPWDDDVEEEADFYLIF